MKTGVKYTDFYTGDITSISIRNWIPFKFYPYLYMVSDISYNPLAKIRFFSISAGSVSQCTNDTLNMLLN